LAEEQMRRRARGMYGYRLLGRYLILSASERYTYSGTRYDDSLAELLERWEQRTRSKEHGIGHRAHNAEADRDEKAGEVALEKIFDDGTWDNRKMVRSFARMGVTDPKDVTEVKTNDVSNPPYHFNNFYGTERIIRQL
jgi:hypothetical protein